jgi:hypothetical protein
MTAESTNIKLDSQVEFFLPVFEAYVEKLVQAFSQSRNKDYSAAEWQLILPNGHIGKLLNHHVLLEVWETVLQFLKKQEKLYGFIEEKASGLVEMKYKFWLFFSPATANDFFKNQINRPKDFNTNNIITLPFIKLFEPITEKLDRVLLDKEISVIGQMGRLSEIIEMADWFLDEAEVTIFDVHVKKAVARLTLTETSSLMKAIHDKASSPVLLEKRLNGLFKIGWRYFRTKNELETKYFKKLLSQDPADREKGLKLTYKKVADYQSSLQ